MRLFEHPDYRDLIVAASGERERRLLHEGLAALAEMDEATRDAYLGEWRDWSDAPLDEPLG